jgi:hypothetical protein
MDETITRGSDGRKIAAMMNP